MKEIQRFRDSELKGVAMLSDVLSAEILIDCYPLVLCPVPCLLSRQCPQSQYKYTKILQSFCQHEEQPSY